MADFSDEQKLAAFKSLSHSQQKYIKNKPAKKAEQSICARMVLAELLGDSPKEKEEILYRISLDENKRPHIAGKEDLFISLSHSDNAVAAAFSDLPIGIDIQKIQPVNQRLVERVLTEDERRFVFAGKNDEFFMLWTAKEAAIKTGTYTYSDVVKTSFVSGNKIILPDGFVLKQDKISNYLISVIESIK